MSVRPVQETQRAGTNLFGEFIGELMRLLGVMLVAVASRPVLVAPVAVAAALVWLLGPGGLLALGLVAGTLLTIWWTWHRDSFRRQVGKPVSRAVRRHCVYGLRWKRVMRGCGLAQREKGSDRFPQLKRVETASIGDRLLVKLLPGQAPADLAKSSEGIRHAYRSAACQVREGPRPGQAWVVLRRGDPLAETIPVPSTVEAPDLEHVQVGRTEDGEPWTLSVRGASHLLLAGASGSGKSGVLWALLRGLGPAIRDGLVEIWAIDPKGGMELGPGKPLYKRFEKRDPQRMAKILEDAVEFKNAREDRLEAAGIRKFEPTCKDPVLIVIVDEIAALSAYIGDKDAQKRIELSLGILLSQGRGPGVIVIGAVQDPREEVLKMRKLFSVKVAMRLEEAREVDMVLGPGSRERGARCDEISEDLPGVGYVKRDKSSEPMRVRACYVSDEDIVRMAEEFRPGAPPRYGVEIQGTELVAVSLEKFA